MSGAGGTAAGRGPYTRIGTASTPGGVVLRDEFSGARMSSRSLDPRTGDYRIDAYGRALGMTRGRQMVLLACRTVRGSSALPYLGNTLHTVKTIGVAFVRQIEGVYRAALAPAEQLGAIEVLAIEVERMQTPIGGNTGVFTRIRWRDLETDLEEETFA